MTQQNELVTLFYSYAHEDEKLREELEKRLSQLRREEMISEWHDRMIRPGAAWAHEIDTYLETASTILLLVSPDFLNSDYCYNHEMKRALERHKSEKVPVIPIILRPCDWQHTPLKDLQCLPRDAKPVTLWGDLDAVFLHITEELRKVIELEQASPHSVVPLSSRDRNNRSRLLTVVRNIWIDGVLEHSLHQTSLITLNLQEQPNALANPWEREVQETKQRPHPLPAGTSIMQVYDKSKGGLLILGKPGAGKTIQLLEITRTLLERAEKDEHLPMPVVFNLSSWAQKQEPLAAWLVEELHTKYLVPREIADRWIASNQVLPLLDGLDEVMPLKARNDCIEKINDYHLKHDGSPFVICCRSREYTMLSKQPKVSREHKRTRKSQQSFSTKLTLLHAISILALTDEQINTYLEQVGESVNGLREALNKDAKLHSLAHQPLMLEIMTLAYQGAAAKDIPTGEIPEKMRHVIFARYVNTMFSRRQELIRWKKKQVIDGLIFLAKQMQQRNQTIFSVEGLQPDWLLEKETTRYKWFVGVVIGLIFGILCALNMGLAFGLSLDPTMLVSLLLFGLGVGTSMGIFRANITEIIPAEALVWSWGTILPVMGGLLILGVIGLFSGPFQAQFIQLIKALLVGLILLLMWGGLSGKQLPRPKRHGFDPNEGIWRSGKNGLMIFLAVGLLAGFFTGFFDKTSGPVPGLLAGLLIGLLGGLIGGLEAFMKHFIVRLWLSRQGDFPWHLVPFLDAAAERLLLLKAGGSYIFRHRMVLDYFASLGESVPSESPSQR